MDLEGAITLARDYAGKHTRSFVSFFRSDGPADTSFEHVITGALIYLVIGSTLQSSYVAGVRADEISWLDRVASQMIFWITIGFIVQLAAGAMRAGAGGNGFLVAFRVMPVAFLCGAYASSLGFVANFVLRIAGTDFPTIPHFCHVIAQVAVVACYMPREIRAHCLAGRARSRTIAGLVVIVVLIVDLTAILAPALLPAEAVTEAGKVDNANR